MTAEELAKSIDQTLLKAETTTSQIEKFCQEAKGYNFACVYVSPYCVSLAARVLSGSPLKVGTTVGFPLGASTTAVKAFEATDAVRNGAEEVDMVLSIGALKSANLYYVRRDIETVARVLEQQEMRSGSGRALLKVIIETCLLTNKEKRLACQLAEEAGADFVKTSTGLAEGGATVEDIRLMRETVSPEVGVKASGGICTYEQALKMLDAGANRIGTSSGVEIMKEFLKVGSGE